MKAAPQRRRRPWEDDTPPHVGALQKSLGLLLVVAALAVGLGYAPERPVQSLVARWGLPPSDFIELQPGQLVHLRDQGPRTDPLPLVLLHGNADSLHTWDGWAERLRNEHRVITLDLPGAGLTGPRADGDYRGEADAAFVLSLLDRLGVRRAVVGGHGSGADTAWRLALQAPRRVAGLVLVAGPPAGTDLRPWPLRVAAWPIVGSTVFRLWPQAVARQLVQAGGGHPPAATAQRIGELMLRAGNGAALQATLRQREPLPAAQPSQPVLLLWGGADAQAPAARAAAVGEALPDARWEVFDRLGHRPQEEDPGATARAVHDFARVLGAQR